MRLTTDEIQSRVAAYVDLDEDTSNIDTADYSLRLKYMNMAQQEWASVQNWKTLYAQYNALVSTSTGNASVALPNDFRQLAGYPLICVGSETKQFSEVLPQDDNQYSDSDERIWILGSPQSGYVLRVFGATLASGASVMVPYYRSPISIATGTTIPDVPSSDYLVQRTIAYVLESREDDRFPIAKAEAERILANMIEYENIFNRASEYDHIKTVEQTRYNFRIGRD